VGDFSSQYSKAPGCIAHSVYILASWERQSSGHCI
jgi:hypothetical protein